MNDETERSTFWKRNVLEGSPYDFNFLKTYYAYGKYVQILLHLILLLVFAAPLDMKDVIGTVLICYHLVTLSFYFIALWIGMTREEKNNAISGFEVISLFTCIIGFAYIFSMIQRSIEDPNYKGNDYSTFYNFYLSFKILNLFKRSLTSIEAMATIPSITIFCQTIVVYTRIRDILKKMDDEELEEEDVCMNELAKKHLRHLRATTRELPKSNMERVFSMLPSPRTRRKIFYPDQFKKPSVRPGLIQIREYPSLESIHRIETENKENISISESDTSFEREIETEMVEKLSVNSEAELKAYFESICGRDTPEDTEVVRASPSSDHININIEDASVSYMAVQKLDTEPKNTDESIVEENKTGRINEYTYEPQHDTYEIVQPLHKQEKFSKTNESETISCLSTSENNSVSNKKEYCSGFDLIKFGYGIREKEIKSKTLKNISGSPSEITSTRNFGVESKSNKGDYEYEEKSVEKFSLGSSKAKGECESEKETRKKPIHESKLGYGIRKEVSETSNQQSPEESKTSEEQSESDDTRL